MSEPGNEPSAPASPKAEPEHKPAPQGPGWGDIAAIGVGCLVFVVFIVAIVLVGMSRR